MENECPDRSAASGKNWAPSPILYKQHCGMGLSPPQNRDVSLFTQFKGLRFFPPQQGSISLPSYSTSETLPRLLLKELKKYDSGSFQGDPRCRWGGTYIRNNLDKLHHYQRSQRITGNNITHDAISDSRIPWKLILHEKLQCCFSSDAESCSINKIKKYAFAVRKLSASNPPYSFFYIFSRTTKSVLSRTIFSNLSEKCLIISLVFMLSHKWRTTVPDLNKT